MKAIKQLASQFEQLEALVFLGFGYVLIKRGEKKPCKKGWKEGASRQQAEQWVKDGNNLGLAIPNGVVVLDVDPRNGGLESWDALCKDLQIAQSPATLTGQTGGGGFHYYFRCKADQRFLGKIEDYPGIDIRQHGNQVVVPPSIHQSGTAYEWKIQPLPGTEEAVMHRLPAALETLLLKPQRSDTGLTEDKNSEDRHPSQGGVFDQVVAPIDGELAKKILDALNAAEFAIHDDWLNFSMALHAACDGDTEVRELWIEWCQSDPAFADCGDQGDRWDSFNRDGGLGLGTVLHILNNHGQRDLADVVSKKTGYATAQAQASLECIARETEQSSEYPVVRDDQLTDLPPISWLFKGLLPRRGYGVIVGRTGTGKSQVALDLALHLAGGNDWLGFKAKRPARVLYIDVENGLSGLQQRRDAWRKTKGLDYPPEHFYAAQVSPRLMVPDGPLCGLIETIRRLDIKLLVIDTLGMSMGGGSVSDGKDMNASLEAKNRIIAETGCAVLLVAHMGKDETKGAKGFTELVDQADVELQIKDGWLTATKLRHSGAISGHGWEVTIEAVALGEDEDGDEITAPVARLGPFAPVAKVQSSQNQLEHFVESVVKEAEEPLSTRQISKRVRDSGVQAADTKFRQVLARLAKSGLLLKQEDGKNNAHLYSLPASSGGIDDLL